MMTQKEIDLQMQKLNNEYTRKRHAIARQKEEVNARKQLQLYEADGEFNAKRRLRLEAIGEMRTAKATMSVEEPKYPQLEAEALNLEQQISVMRADNEQRKRSILHKAYAERRDLDEQSRQLTEWFNDEKLKVMQQLVAEQ